MEIGEGITILSIEEITQEEYFDRKKNKTQKFPYKNEFNIICWFKLKRSLTSKATKKESRFTKIPDN